MSWRGEDKVEEEIVEERKTKGDTGGRDKEQDRVGANKERWEGGGLQCRTRPMREKKKVCQEEKGRRGEERRKLGWAGERSVRKEDRRSKWHRTAGKEANRK